MQDRIRYRVTSAAASEPVTATEAKLHASVSGADWDSFFTEKIESARIKVEQFANRSLVTRTYTGKMDCFPYESDDDLSILLPFPPMASVTSIYYLNSAGVSTLLPTTVYGVDTYSEPGRIYLKYNQVWPATYVQADAITIVWVAGFGAAAAVPANFKTAISQLVAHWYKFREAAISGTIIADVPDGWEALVNADRIMVMA